MINDIRFQASKILELSNNNLIQTVKDEFQEIYENAFDDVFQEQTNEIEKSENTNKTCMPLGIPANFLYEFSMMESGFEDSLNDGNS